MTVIGKICEKINDLYTIVLKLVLFFFSILRFTKNDKNSIFEYSKLTVLIYNVYEITNILPLQNV